MVGHLHLGPCAKHNDTHTTGTALGGNRRVLMGVPDRGGVSSGMRYLNSMGTLPPLPQPQKRGVCGLHRDGGTEGGRHQ